MSTPTLADAVTFLDGRFPPQLAQDWDRVGLVCGDPTMPVTKVMFAVDPVSAVVDEALAWGADLLVTHHPLLLRGVHSVAATGFKGAVVHRLVRGGCALYAAHTNADAAADGVADALADAIGLVGCRPLVPADPASRAVSGTDIGEGLGRIGELADPCTLDVFARRVAAALPPTAAGVRYAGDRDGVVRTVAVVGGAGDSELATVRASGADVYLTADLRHHPASEAREQALFDAATGGRPAATPYLVEVAHSASEWLWLPAAAAALVAGLGGSVETRVSTLTTDPWTGHVSSPTREGAS